MSDWDPTVSAFPSEPLLGLRHGFAAPPMPTCCWRAMTWTILTDEARCAVCGRTMSGCAVVAWRSTFDVGVPSLVDPLDAVIDGMTLRRLLELDTARRREQDLRSIPYGLSDLFTAAQREAVSAHWSAELRAKVAAAKAADAERERNRVLVDLDPEDP